MRTYAEFKDRLQYLIDIKNISQVAVADAIGVQDSRISDWLKGKPANPQRKSCVKLANFFQCNVDWLQKNIGEPFTQLKTGEIAATLGDLKHRQKKPEETEKEAPATEINIQEGVSMTEMVLLSNTSYADALWANIKSFAKAVEMEKDMNELKENMREMERKISDKMERMEKLLLSLGATDQEKRDSAAQS